MGSAYPELGLAQSLIEETLQEETVLENPRSWIKTT